MFHLRVRQHNCLDSIEKTIWAVSLKNLRQIKSYTLQTSHTDNTCKHFTITLYSHFIKIFLISLQYYQNSLWRQQSLQAAEPLFTVDC